MKKFIAVVFIMVTMSTQISAMGDFALHGDADDCSKDCRRGHIVEKGIDVKDLGLKPLHKAVLRADIEAIKAIIRSAGDKAWEVLSGKANNGRTPFHFAAGIGNTAIVEIFIEAAKELDKVYELISMQDIKGDTALHTAACCGRKEAIKIILEAAGDKAQDLVLMQDGSGQTPMHGAIISTENCKEIMVNLFLDAAGDNIETLLFMVDEDGKRALDYAWDDPEIFAIIKAAEEKLRSENE